jgi:hypothetical protein
MNASVHSYFVAGGHLIDLPELAGMFGLLFISRNIHRSNANNGIIMINEINGAKPII